MEVKEIVSENLIALRKLNNLTQQDLSKKINYSDKAISRWEKCEAMPDYDTLKVICDLYGVSMGYMFIRHLDLKEAKKAHGEKIALCVLGICIVYTLVTIAFAYCRVIRNWSFWQLFIWAVPVSCLVELWLNRKYLHNSLFKFILVSVFVWSTIVSIYCQTIKYNLWLLFIVGIPIQLALMVGRYMEVVKKR